MTSIAQYNPGLAELGERNQPNGYVGINSDGLIVGTFTHRVGTAAEIAAITLAAGELAFTTDTLETRRGDGVTAGGIWLASKAQFAAASNVTTIDSVGPNDAAALSFAVTAGRYMVQGYAEINKEFGGNVEYYLRGPVGNISASVDSVDVYSNIMWSEDVTGPAISQLVSVNDATGDTPYKYRPPTGIASDALEVFIQFQSIMRFTAAGTLKYAVVPQTATANNTRKYWLQIQKVAE